MKKQERDTLEESTREQHIFTKKKKKRKQHIFWPYFGRSECVLFNSRARTTPSCKITIYLRFYNCENSATIYNQNSLWNLYVSTASTLPHKHSLQHAWVNIHLWLSSHNYDLLNSCNTVEYQYSYLLHFTSKCCKILAVAMQKRTECQKLTR